MGSTNYELRFFGGDVALDGDLPAVVPGEEVAAQGDVGGAALELDCGAEFAGDVACQLHVVADDGKAWLQGELVAGDGADRRFAEGGGVQGAGAAGRDQEAL